VTSTTAGRRALLPSDRMAQLLVDVLAENRRTKRFQLPLEKALQFIKGGFSYRAKREIHFAF
jgi:hypothetical protein